MHRLIPLEPECEPDLDEAVVIGIAGVKLGGAAVGAGVFPPIEGGKPGPPNPGGGELGTLKLGGKN